MKRKGLPIVWLTLTALLTCFSLTTIASADDSQFIPYQTIPTSGAADWEFFTIDGQQYLIVANGRNNNTHELPSILYRWNGTQFVEFQAIPANAARRWVFFTLEEQHFLAVAEHRTQGAYAIDSNIYRWDGTQFLLFQSIPTHAGFDVTYFTIGNDAYLAFANQLGENVAAYQWDGTQFTHYQAIPAHHPQGVEFFTIDTQHFLAVANSHDNAFNDIYRWNGTIFVEFQAIPTEQANDWHHFTIDNTHYLVVANGWNGSSPNIDSKIYHWNGTAFVEFQAILTHNARSWQSFTIGNQFFLAVANGWDGNHGNIDSVIYRWDDSQFVEFQAIGTHHAQTWEPFTIANSHYLAVANYATDNSTYEIDSMIYQYQADEIELTAVSSSNTPLYPGDTFPVALNINNADDLYAAQATCATDNNLALPQSGTFADLFDPTSRLVVANQVSNGSWLGAISQQNPAPPITGAGSWATLTFQAQAPGDTHIICTPLFANRDGDALAGSYTTGPATTILPFAVLNGTVTYQGRNDHAAISITAVADHTHQTTTNATGAFTLNDLRTDTYNIRADSGGYLPTCTDLALTSGNTQQLNETILWGGDSNNDEIINIGDATLLGANFNANVPPADARADINHDGVVNVLDLALLGGNYGKQGCQPW